MELDLDLDQLMQDMAGAAGEAVGEAPAEIAEQARKALEGQREALADLAEARLEGRIDDEILERQVDREQRVFRTEMLAVRMMSEAAAEQAWNAARDRFLSAVQSAVRGAL